MEKKLQDGLVDFWSTFDEQQTSESDIKCTLRVMKMAGLPNNHCADPDRLLLFDRLWRQHFPDEAPDYSHMTGDLPTTWFANQKWIGVFCDNTTNTWTSVPLWNILNALGEEPFHCTETKYADSFKMLLKYCAENIDVRQNGYTPLGAFVEKLCNSLTVQESRRYEFASPAYDFDALLDNILTPLMEAGANSDLRLYLNKYDTATIFERIYALCCQHSIRSPPGASFHLLLGTLWRYRKSAFGSSYPSVLLYAISLTLEREQRVLIQTREVYQLPAYIRERMDLAPPPENFHDVTAFNPFSMPYRGLLIYLRQAIGFCNDTTHPFAFDESKKDGDGSLREQWKHAACMVQSINYICTQGHLARSIYYEQADQDDDRRKTKMPKIGE